jgi:uncharacterized protein
VYASHYHCCEYDQGNLYVIKRTGDDSIKGVRDDGSPITSPWTDELWRFHLGKEGQKIFEAQGLDFRVSPKGDLIAVIQEDKLVFLDPTGKAVHGTDFAQMGKDIDCDKFHGAHGDAGPHMWKWSKDGSEFWGSIECLYVTARFFKIDVPSWKLTVYRRTDTSEGAEKGWPSNELDLDPDSRKVAYSDYPFIFDVETEEEFRKSRRRVHLYVYDLETGLDRLMATSTAKEFKPEWLDAYLLEYNDPSGKNRIRLNLDPGYATGIDCGKATSHVTKLICADEELLAEDYELSYYYQVLLSVALDVQSAERERLAWIAKRNKCGDAACITKVYQERRKEIEQHLSNHRLSDKERRIAEEYFDEEELYADSTNGEKESLGKYSCCVIVERASSISSVDFAVRFPDSGQILTARVPATRGKTGALNFRFADGWGNWGKGSFIEEGEKGMLRLEAVKEVVKDLWGRNVLRQYGEYSLSKVKLGTCLQRQQ